MIEILKGEFFWGVIVGLLLSFFGGWVLAKFTISLTQFHHKKMVVKFCIDTIKNLQNIIKEMDSMRDRTKAIHLDFLALIDVEIGVYGRNREHLIHLTEPTRDQVRKFMNDCAVKKAEIVWKLSQYYQLDSLANQVQAQGRGPEAQRIRTDSSVPLADAQKAADRLAAIGNGVSQLLTDLSKL